MDPNVNEWLNLVFRWIHIGAGILWIGHLYFFNFVNAQVVKTYDADSKKKVLPELMPRALYWFRWGAAFTWITGLLLLGLVYYMESSNLLPNAPGAQNLGIGATTGIGLALPVIAFLVYHYAWKMAFAKQETVGVAVSYVLIVAVAFGLAQIMSGRSMFIHVGAMLGTIMAGNVWMVIWPAQRKIIGGVKGTSPAPDASVAATAGLRSKHNTYMSLPLLAMMISNHYGTVVGNPYNWAIVAAFVAAGFGTAKFLYVKSASPAPAQF
jgi:uncharacterized membrane protein